VKRIKRIGLAAFAVLALTAFGNVTAASASPEGFLAGGYIGGGAVIKGDSPLNYSDGWNTMSVMGTTLECVPPSIATTQESPSSTLVGDWWSGDVGTCYGYVYPWGNYSSPLDMNGCEFTFDPGPGPSFDGTFTIGPSGCGPIEFDAIPYCHAQIDPQSSFSASAKFSNQGTGSSAYVNASLQATGLKYTRSGVNCSTGTFSLDYSPGWRLTAKNVIGEQESLQVVDDLPLGFYLTGRASGNPSEQPRFEAETYPLPVAGGGLDTFTTPSETIHCTTSILAGQISRANKQLALNAGYSGCGITGTSYVTRIDMHSCQYVLDVQNSGPPYSSAFSIACGGSDKIELKSYNSGGALVCTATIAPQTGLSGVALANVGSGSDRGVAVNATVRGVAYSQSGACGSKSSTATLTGRPTLMGVG
jgi:hypothetical protein